MSTDRAMSAQTSSATIASSAAGPSTSDRSSTSTHVDIPNHTTSSSSSSSLRRRKSRNGKERAYSQFTSGMMADERIHSTMTERVFKIKCFERVQVEKSTSAFSSIVSVHCESFGRGLQESLAADSVVISKPASESEQSIESCFTGSP
jgi:hypothetical protein